jgi:hypothetical protein
MVFISPGNGFNAAERSLRQAYLVTYQLANVSILTLINRLRKGQRRGELTEEQHIVKDG